MKNYFVISAFCFVMVLSANAKEFVYKEKDINGSLCFKTCGIKVLNSKNCEYINGKEVATENCTNEQDKICLMNCKYKSFVKMGLISSYK